MDANKYIPARLQGVRQIPYFHALSEKRIFYTVASPEGPKDSFGRFLGKPGEQRYQKQKGFSH